MIVACDSCDHNGDYNCTRSEKCVHCDNGFCYCDTMVDTEYGLKYSKCAKKGRA